MVSLFDRLRAPNVKKLEAKGDTAGLGNALAYEKDPQVRLAAAQALGRIGDSQVTPALCEALEDEEKDVRYAAVAALEKVGDHLAVDRVLHMLTSEKKYPPKAVDALTAIFARTEDRDHQAKLIGLLLDTLDSREGVAHDIAFKTMGHIMQMELGAAHRERIVRALLPMVDDDDERFRGDVVVALKHAVPRLAATDLYVPIAQAVSQEQILSVAGLRPTALTILTTTLEHVDDAAVLTAAREAFTRYIDAHYADVRLLCMQGLARIGAEDDLWRIARQFRSETQAQVQQAAASALGQIDPNKSAEILLEMIAAFDRQREREAYYKTNWFGAVRALGTVGEDWVVAPLIAILGHEDFRGSPSLQAATELGEIGDKRAVEPLIIAMEGDDKTLRQEAAKALQAITGEHLGEAAQPWREWWEEASR